MQPAHHEKLPQIFLFDDIPVVEEITTYRKSWNYHVYTVQWINSDGQEQQEIINQQNEEYKKKKGKKGFEAGTQIKLPNL